MMMGRATMRDFMRPGAAVATAIMAAVLGLAGVAQAAEEAEKPPRLSWSFSGVFGTFDRAEVQRGLQVYTEVCAACHTLRHVAYRHIAGIGFSADQIKAYAAQFEVEDGPDDNGEMFFRPAVSADRFVAPYRNEQEARLANNGAVPPDLSLMTRARPAGTNYLHALLTGYEEPPADFELLDGASYNLYFAGHQIGMPQPLFEDSVVYENGPPATVDQMARDVTAFLAWTADPTLEDRKRVGIKVVLFMIILAGLMYASKRRLWSTLH